MPVPPHATIRSRIGFIDKPEDFLITVMRAMRSLDAHNNGAVVRVGIGGKGTHPNFKIGQVGAPQSEHIPFDYNGPRFTGETQTHAHLWSEAFMTYADVTELLGDLRAKRV